jgi:hypothetical protein
MNRKETAGGSLGQCFGRIRIAQRRSPRELGDAALAIIFLMMKEFQRLQGAFTTRLFLRERERFLAPEGRCCRSRGSMFATSPMERASPRRSLAHL